MHRKFLTLITSQAETNEPTHMNSPKKRTTGSRRVKVPGSGLQASDPPVPEPWLDSWREKFLPLSKNRRAVRTKVWLVNSPWEVQAHGSYSRWTGFWKVKPLVPHGYWVPGGWWWTSGSWTIRLDTRAGLKDNQTLPEWWTDVYSILAKEFPDGRNPTRELSMEDWMLLGRFVPWWSMVNHSWL